MTYQEAYEDAVTQVLSRTTYGIRNETARAKGWTFQWSNGSRTWNRVHYSTSQVKKGQPVVLDASQIIIYAPARKAEKIAKALPALPLYKGSEFRERGEPPPEMLSNPPDSKCPKCGSPLGLKDGMPAWMEQDKIMKERDHCDECGWVGEWRPVPTGVDKRKKGRRFRSNPAGYVENNPGKTPEEEWIEGEESKGPHDRRDPAHSPYEGDIPPWAQADYSGHVPTEGRHFYVNAYAAIRYKVGFELRANLSHGTKFIHGIAPKGLSLGSDYDFYPFASIPVRRGELGKKDKIFDYIRSLAKKLPLEFVRIEMENSFPSTEIQTSGSGSEVRGHIEEKDGKYFTYTMESPFSHPRLEYVNAYVINRLYGGQEEGGWWYDEGTPIASVPIMRGKETKGWERYLAHNIGWSSQHDLGSVLGHDVYGIRHQDHFAEGFPKESPHYE